MNRLLVCLTAVVVAALATSRAQSRPSPISEDFKVFLARFEKGVTGFVNGDPALWKQHASRRDDVTLMGGWGTYEKGWEKVGARYEWAATRFRPSGAIVTVEYVTTGESGDLAYTVNIERSVVQVGEQPAPAPMALRVSHLFRREDGTWRLVHRHADPLLGTASDTSVLQKK